MRIPGADDKRKANRDLNKAVRRRESTEKEYSYPRGWESAGLFPGMTDNNKGGHGMKWKKWPHPFADNPGLVIENVSVSPAAGDGE